MTRPSIVALPAALVLATLALAACTPQPSRDRDQASMPSADIRPPPGQDRTASRWTREAEAADRAALEDAAALLRSARDAMSEPRGADRAIEMLERAESRLLTRSTPQGTEQRPMNEGAQARVAGARRSLSGNNRQEALQEIAGALQDILEEQQASRR